MLKFGNVEWHLVWYSMLSHIKPLLLNVCRSVAAQALDLNFAFTFIWCHLDDLLGYFHSVLDIGPKPPQKHWLR